MKYSKQILALTFVTCMLPVYAVDYPVLSHNGTGYTLTIPYFEMESLGGKNAYEVKLNSSQIENPQFTVDFSSLQNKTLGNPASIEGENTCLKTAHGAFLACQSETRVDFAIDTVRCLNTSDSECSDDIDESFTQEMQECEAINQARIAVCGVLGGAAYLQDLDPSDFIDPTTITDANANPYLPLVAGNTWVYQSGEETVTVTVTNQTREIQGINAVVVKDVVTENGELVEDTDDWFAQDKNGNIWYMGELSKNYEDGWLDDLDGSWRAGDEAAQAGILMYAKPENHINETYRQEFLAGEAEDYAQVISVTATTANEHFSCNGNCLQTYEGSPLEPAGFEDNTPETKFYAPGIGMIRAYHFDPETGELAEGEAVEELISFTPGS